MPHNNVVVTDQLRLWEIQALHDQSGIAWVLFFVLGDLPRLHSLLKLNHSTFSKISQTNLDFVASVRLSMS